MQRVAQAYSSMEFEASKDVDLALYDNFFSENDRILMSAVRNASPRQLTHHHFDFQDKRLHELLFRYRARNWPDTLSANELQRWRNLCRQHLMEKNCGNSMILTEFADKIKALRDAHIENAHIVQILNTIETWGRELATANNIPWDF
jgi:exodeoxyribonuclease-1